MINKACILTADKVNSLRRVINLICMTRMPTIMIFANVWSCSKNPYKNAIKIIFLNGCDTFMVI